MMKKTLNRDDVSDRMGPNNICMTWRDNESLVLRTRSTDWNDWKGQLFLAKTNGAPSSNCHFLKAVFVVIHPINKIAYNKFFVNLRQTRWSS